MLKRAFDEKRFGRVYMVSINDFWSRPQEYYGSASGVALGNSMAVPS